MNEKQYLRANKRVFLAVTIIFAYITLTMLAALAASHGESLCPDYDPVSGFGRCDYHFRIGLSDPKENAHLCHHPDNRHDGRLCSCCFTKYHGRDMGLRASPHYCRHGLSE